jgi:hypothetical protein
MFEGVQVKGFFRTGVFFVTFPWSLSFFGWKVLLWMQNTFRYHIWMRLEIIMNWNWAFHHTELIEITIAVAVEMLTENCHFVWKSLSPTIFKSMLRLSQIDHETLHATGLVKISIPWSIQLLNLDYFFLCSSLSSVTFESMSRLWRNENRVILGIQLIEIVITASVQVLDQRCLSEVNRHDRPIFESESTLSRTEKCEFLETRLAGLSVLR